MGQIKLRVVSKLADRLQKNIEDYQEKIMKEGYKHQAIVFDRKSKNVLVFTVTFMGANWLVNKMMVKFFRDTMKKQDPNVKVEVLK